MKKLSVNVLSFALFLIAVSVTGPVSTSYADSGARGEAISRVAGRGGTTYSRGYTRGGYSYGSHRQGGGYFSGSVYIGPGWGWDPFFYPYYSYPAYPYYYTPPTVVVPQGPQEYISPDTGSADDKTGYWYYCRKPEGYYPYVERCPSGWMKVVPNTTPPAQSEEDKED